MIESILLFVIIVAGIAILTSDFWIYPLFKTKEQEKELRDLEIELYILEFSNKSIIRHVVDKIHNEKVRKIKRDILWIESEKEVTDGR